MACTDIMFSQIQATQRAIKHALTERYYAWEDARKVAVEHPEHRDEVKPDPPNGQPAYTAKLYNVCVNSP